MVVNNPNNWHWVDKNCIDWSKKYFADKLAGLSVKTEDGRSVGIKSVSSVEGDVEVCQRKGKVISLFDLKLTLNVEGFAEPDAEAFSGSIVIPELAYDTDADDIQFDISIYNENKALEAMRAVIKKSLLPKLRELLAKFGTDLIVTHSSDIQLSSDQVKSTFTKANQESSIKGQTIEKKVVQPTETKVESAPSVGPRYNTSTLHLEPTFNAPAEQLYITLLDSQRILAWTRSAPQIEDFPPSEGSSFSFFGGNITGKLLKLVPNERIVQLWRLGEWKSGHYAELDITLVQGAGETKMVVKWSGIPVGEEDRVRANFEEYYIRSIKLTFGFGAVL